jgi:DNA mismatch endonuclease Vsr
MIYSHYAPVIEPYVRDSRSPAPTTDNVSKVMSANKRKDTKPELILRKILRESGCSGYRLQWNVPGRPDVAYPGKRIAIFVNGCYWHRCPSCNLPLPKNNTTFWNDKFKKNIERDAKKICTLKNEGWTVITIWECEIKHRKFAIDYLITLIKKQSL